jgi:hypothetical protein
MALLLGPLLYRHVFHKGAKPQSHDIGPQAAKAFWRAHAIDQERTNRRARAGKSLQETT